MRTLIVVPARYGSKRFPGKPLKKINGISMLRRTSFIARKTAEEKPDCDHVVAIDDVRIKAHCEEHGIPYVMTPTDIQCGTERALSACNAIEISTEAKYTHIINLQGDSPFTPHDYLYQMLKALSDGAEVVTPYVRLSWESLEEFRTHKVLTPHSGTSVILSSDEHAIWFSKNIIPRIRDEVSLRKSSPSSPICRHVGLYGYRRDTLEKFVKTPKSNYEQLESLEQLRFLENGTSIKCVEVQPATISISGIDTPEDLELAERMILRFGDPYR